MCTCMRVLYRVQAWREGVRAQVRTVLGATLPTVKSTLTVKAQDAHGSLEPELSLWNSWEGRSRGDRHQDEADTGEAQGAFLG